MTAVAPPDLALRLALAGKRRLGEHEALLEATLRAVFDAIHRRLDAIIAGRMSWYSGAPARLSLATGLADGADQVASEAFLAGGKAGRTLAAVLPFGRDTYCAVSPVSDRDRFLRLVAASAYVVELEPATPAAELAGPERRGKRIAGYRAQAEVMLNQADILIAVDNTDVGEEGGTFETTRRALDNGLPVIRILLGSGTPVVLHTVDDLDHPPPRAGDWVKAIEALVDRLVLPSEVSGGGKAHAHEAAEQAGFATEFFSAREPRRRLRQRLWWWFEHLFRPPAASADEPAPPPIEAYRLRANDLNARYASLYRGTFLLGYGLAVVAVVLAGLSLIVLLMNPTAHSPKYLAWWALLGLGAAKLVAVIWIQRASRSANTLGWAERAVDYRYLAEMLRTMTYLPLAGGFRLPQAPSLPFTTRVAAQRQIEHLFRAIVRHLTPVTAGAAVLPAGAMIRPDPAAALRTIRSGWLGGQLAYHRRNATGMAAMSRSLEKLANALSIAVVIIVVIDLFLLVATGLHWLPEAPAELVYDAAPWLLFLAAVMPAAIASLNGIRFQSECARLADRSEQMIGILEAFDRRAASLEGGNGRSERLPIIDVLRLAQQIARVMVDEVADWSALYAKELVEP